MDTPFDVPDLETIWYEPDTTKLQCLVCEKPFDQSALVRTYRVARQQPDDRSVESLACSRVIPTHLGTDILLYDRHLDCILHEKIAFTAVSHVWDPEVSRTQIATRHSLQSVSARQQAIESPVRIYEGLMQEKRDEDGEELWHDYLSVPQWTGGVKTDILGVIQTIFSSAATTLFYFHDLSGEAVRKLRYGGSSDERLQGLVGVCNALWFGRTWTAMEFVRSARVRMMTAGYQPVGVPNDPVFLGRLQEVWEEELKKYQSVYELECKVDVGRNMVPWNLGPLAQVRALKRTNFAMAFALLSKRECRDESDFLYALSGIVSAASPRLPFGKNVRDETAELARCCIEGGDYSPLLMMPDLGDRDRRAHPDYALNTGYNDVRTWELGEQISGPDFVDDVSFSADREMLTLRLEKIGVVMMVRQANGGVLMGEPVRNFSRCAALALELTGPSVEDFVTSVGTRLYGVDTGFIMGNLKANGKVDVLRDALHARFDDAGRRHDAWTLDGPGGAQWLADVMGLSTANNGEAESRLAASLGRYGTMHCRELNYIVGITCTSCHRTSPFRVAGFEPSAAALHGARAYRVPGLRYRMSIEGGTALLEKGGKVVGRMMWAAPACGCVEMELVRLDMPDLPPPRPRSRFLSPEARPAYRVFLGGLARGGGGEGEGEGEGEEEGEEEG